MNLEEKVDYLMAWVRKHDREEARKRQAELSAEEAEQAAYAEMMWEQSYYGTD